MTSVTSFVDHAREHATLLDAGARGRAREFQLLPRHRRDATADRRLRRRGRRAAPARQAAERSHAAPVAAWWSPRTAPSAPPGCPAAARRSPPVPAPSALRRSSSRRRAAPSCSMIVAESGFLMTSTIVRPSPVREHIDQQHVHQDDESIRCLVGSLLPREIHFVCSPTAGCAAPRPTRRTARCRRCRCLRRCAEAITPAAIAYLDALSGRRCSSGWTAIVAAAFSFSSSAARSASTSPFQYVAPVPSMSILTISA